MKKTTRIIFLILNVLLCLVYFLPIWKIQLLAPQYPEGLQMTIWLNKMSGNLDTINNLNHYIGMKFITPDSITELKLMPYILGFFIIFGFLGVILNKLNILKIWFGLLAVAGITGFVDFYMWMYDYGHNLDPHAAIKIPGMSFQPAIIGTKKLLNFTATSLPEIGGVILILTGITAFILILTESKKRKMNVSFIKQPVMAILLSLSLVSCSVEAEPINYGTDACHICKMNIVDNKYGGEIVTSKGKIFKFDAVSCMFEYYKDKSDQQKDLVFVTDFAHPGKLIDAKTAFFLDSDKLSSPMGADIAGFETKVEMENIQKLFPGKVLNWQQLTKFAIK